MAKATFDEAGLTGAFSKTNMNNQHKSIYQGDFAQLRPRAQATPNMTILVGSASVESYYEQLWGVAATPISYAGGSSSAISAPAGNPRIDLLYLNTSNVLTWIAGTEAASPTAPDFTWKGIPLCYVYCKTTMTKIVNYEDQGANPNEGYIYRDIRPQGILGLSILENRTADPSTPATGRIWIRTDL